MNGLKEVMHHGGDWSDANGKQARQLRLFVVNRPGVLAEIALGFAALYLNIEEMTLRGDPQDPARAQIRLTFAADARECDLIRRKLDRLIDVLDVLAEPAKRCSEIEP